MVTLYYGDALVGDSIKIADTFGSRFLGLMFRKRLPRRGGLLLTPCSSIHMCFMRMALDIVYLDLGFRVLGVEEGLRPWRIGRAARGTRQVLEVPRGTLARCGIKSGEVLTVQRPVPENCAIANQEEEVENCGYQTGSCCES